MKEKNVKIKAAVVYLLLFFEYEVAADVAPTSLINLMSGTSGFHAILPLAGRLSSSFEKF